MAGDDKLERRGWGWGEVGEEGGARSTPHSCPIRAICPCHTFYTLAARKGEHGSGAIPDTVSHHAAGNHRWLSAHIRAAVYSPRRAGAACASLGAPTCFTLTAGAPATSPPAGVGNGAQSACEELALTDAPEEHSGTNGQVRNGNALSQQQGSLKVW